MSQPTVNAYYDPQENDINFPAGILQPPFYDNKMDDAVNYGAIGAVIGHELTHGFDDQGRQYDDKGNLRDWWTEADAKAFDALADCLVKQYGSYTAVDDVKVNGKLTLGENTADNGGLRIAYMALMDMEAGKQPAADRRVHRGSTLLPRLGAGVVREPDAGERPAAGADQSAFSGGGSGERRGLEYAGVPQERSVARKASQWRRQNRAGFGSGALIMLDITKDIQSLTTFRRKSGDFMKQLKKSKRPVVLTVKGKALAVVQDADAYQRLLDIAARADVFEAVRQGLDDSTHGRSGPAKEVFDEIRRRNDIPR